MTTRTVTGWPSIDSLGAQPGDTLLVQPGSGVAAYGQQVANVTLQMKGTTAAPAYLWLASGNTGPWSLHPATFTNGDNQVVHVGEAHVFGAVYVDGGLALGGRNEAPERLSVHVHGADGNLSLDGGGSIQDNSSVTIDGDAGAVTWNNGVLAVGASSAASLTVNTTLNGNGLIRTNETAYNGGGGNSIHLGGAVGWGQRIDLSYGSLLLDKPMEFGGEITGFDNYSSLALGAPVLWEAFNQTGAADGFLTVLLQNKAAPSGFDVANIHMAGTYGYNAFEAHSSGTGGSIVLAPTSGQHIA